jgi:hypothetical protein
MLKRRRDSYMVPEHEIDRSQANAPMRDSNAAANEAFRVQNLESISLWLH